MSIKHKHKVHEILPLLQDTNEVPPPIGPVASWVSSTSLNCTAIEIILCVVNKANHDK